MYLKARTEISGILGEIQKHLEDVNVKYQVNRENSRRFFKGCSSFMGLYGLCNGLNPS